MAKFRLDIFCALIHLPAMTETIRMPTPAQIRKLALEKELTIPALCRRADLVPETFYRWEAGRGTPTVSTVQRLLDVLQGTAKQ